MVGKVTTMIITKIVPDKNKITGGKYLDKEILNYCFEMMLTCLLSTSGSFSPLAKIGIIRGSTLSPSFLTSSPSDLPATYTV